VTVCEVGERGASRSWARKVRAPSDNYAIRLSMSLHAAR
jgi:hypothetical protein